MGWRYSATNEEHDKTYFYDKYNPDEEDEEGKDEIKKEKKEYNLKKAKIYINPLEDIGRKSIVYIDLIDDHVYFTNKEAQNRKGYVMNNFKKRMEKINITVRNISYEHFKKTMRKRWIKIAFDYILQTILNLMNA